MEVFYLLYKKVDWEGRKGTMIDLVDRTEPLKDCRIVNCFQRYTT